MSAITLRVKIKSLAAEARIIVREERRVLGWVLRDPTAHAEYVGLRAHRRGVVGRAAREALLAYGFLRGRPYARLEPPNSSAPDWDGIRKVAERFAPDGDGLGERWSAWRTAAEAHRAV